MYITRWLRALQFPPRLTDLIVPSSHTPKRIELACERACVHVNIRCRRMTSWMFRYSCAISKYGNGTWMRLQLYAVLKSLGMWLYYKCLNCFAIVKYQQFTPVWCFPTRPNWAWLGVVRCFVCNVSWPSWTPQRYRIFASWHRSK